MIQRIATRILLLSLVAATSRPDGLQTPEKKEIAMQLVSAAENSSLDWKKQYGYIEYNVEGNEKDNRGYTGGLIGFTSKTSDMLAVVRRFDRLEPHNILSPFLPALEKADGTSSREGLGDLFIHAWKMAAHDANFKHAQNAERDKTYFDPAVEAGAARWIAGAGAIHLLRRDGDARAGR